MSHSHVGSLFYELERFMVMMSICYFYVYAYCCDRVEQPGECGSLGRKWWVEGRGYSEISMW
jgi:hypothetical protein